MQLDQPTSTRRPETVPRSATCPRFRSTTIFPDPSRRARQLEETGILNPAPGRTANELARDAGAALPHLTDELSQAATAFNDVTYGEVPGTQAAYQTIVDLDNHLRMRAPAAAATAGQHAPVESWAQVR